MIKTVWDKKWLVLINLYWKSILNFKGSIFLYFMIAGHPKRTMDAFFGHMKQNLKYKDKKTRVDIINFIATSCQSTQCVPLVEVCWRLWGDFFYHILLLSYSKAPTIFLITKHQVFCFENISSNVSKCQTIFVFEWGHFIQIAWTRHHWWILLARKLDQCGMISNVLYVFFNGDKFWKAWNAPQILGASCRTKIFSEE